MAEATLFALVFFATILTLYFARLVRAVENLGKVTSEDENKAYNVVVEEGYVSEETLPLGIYHPNYDDASLYLVDKAQEIRDGRRLVPLDWRIEDDEA